MGHSIDINCDMGESYGQFIVGSDEEIFPLITSCSIACGFHGGDPVHMEKTILSALEHKVQIGAHPSYPDRWGFGRRHMSLPGDELRAFLRYQLAAIEGMTRALGAGLAYVKPHGALYSRAVEDRNEAMAIIEAILSLGKSMPVMGPAGSQLEAAARQSDLPFVTEAFADRRYRNGKLIPRGDRHAVVHDPGEAAGQAVSIVLDKRVFSPEGEEMPVDARSICVHSDNRSVVQILNAIDQELKVRGITKQAFVA